MPLIAGLAVLWFVVIAWATRDNREAANDGRSIDRYSHAMRVLSRRPPARSGGTAGGRYVVVPGTRVTDPSFAAARMLERRRKVLHGLLTASAVSFAGLLLGGPWFVIHLVVDVALVAYVVFLRRIALHQAERARRERLARLREREEAHRRAYEAAHEPVATVLPMPERVERKRAVGD
ncbi:MAG TPA: hypothetical protein VF519_05160 [Mycobacteriales bacterium]